jgi:nitrite reductase (NO-forming)
MYFEPKTLRAVQGERVSITLVNDDQNSPHDWALLAYDGEDIENYVDAGQQRAVSFTATEPGEYRIVCQLVGHKQAGMEGDFIVTKQSTPAAPLAAALVLVALVALAGRRSRA